MPQCRGPLEEERRENAFWENAARPLGELLLNRHGFEAEVVVTRITPEHSAAAEPERGPGDRAAGASLKRKWRDFEENPCNLKTAVLY